MVVEWQKSVKNWVGRDLSEKSTRLLHSGNLYKNKECSEEGKRNVSLFELQLVICIQVNIISF